MHSIAYLQKSWVAFENEDDEETLAPESTTATNESQPHSSEVIEEPLNVRSHRRTAISTVQTRCVDVHREQHRLEWWFCT